MTLIGHMVALVLMICGFKPHLYKRVYYINIRPSWGACTLGQMFLRDTTSDDTLNAHEYGHTFQNAVLGVFFPFLVALPSAIRYWIPIKKDYDAIWFEGSATDIGNAVTK